MDQSTYGTSQMSFIDGQSQVSAFSGIESSFSTQPQEQVSGSIITTALLGTFCMLIVIICSGVALAFFVGDDFHPTEDIEGPRSGVDSGRGGPVSGGGGRSNGSRISYAGTVTAETISSGGGGSNNGSRISYAATQILALTTTSTTKRSGLTFCVLGENFVVATPIVNGWCDYAVYPDLVAVDGRFQPLYGQTSWSAFEKAITAQPNFAPGVSFWEGSAGVAGSTLSQIPSMGAQLQELVRMKRVRAMGLLNFARHSSLSTHTLAPVFKALDNALQGQTDFKTMTFLGVWLYNQKTAMDFVSEVVSINANLTTIILQTHISEVYTSSTTCISRPICVKNSTDDLPSFSIAKAVVSALRSQGDRFRLMFSSTLGAMVYMGAENSGEPSGANKPCERSFMVDIDLVCNTTSQPGYRKYEAVDKYEYLLFRANNREYYATYETVQSIYDKYEIYISDVSDGWALFEIQRDAGSSCSVTQVNYDRLEAAQGPARSRTY